MTSFGLEVHEFAHASSGKDSVASTTTDLSKAQSEDQRYEVAEVDVTDIASAYALQKARRLHVGDRNDMV